MGVDIINIIFDRPGGVYFAGELIKGVVQLKTSGSVTCRGFRLAFKGESRTHWHTGEGDNRTDYEGHKLLAGQILTLHGNLWKTPVLHGTGADAQFGSSFGVMHVPCSLGEGTTSSSSSPLPLFVRVMDYDWGKKDDLCGEVVVDAKRLAQQGDAVSLPLWYKGKRGKGEITISARLIPYVASAVLPDHMRDAVVPNHSHVLILTVWQATGLRKADWFGKNDVYIQTYFPDPEDAIQYRGRTWSDWLNAGETPKLPPPTKKTSLPLGWSSFPFFLQIPPECPGSVEFRWVFILFYSSRRHRHRFGSPICSVYIS